MSDALAIGRAAHCLVMRPDEFGSEIVLGTEKDCGKSRTNKKYADFQARIKAAEEKLKSF